MSPRPLVVPVDLGGSPHSWLLQPPRRPTPTPDVVSALVQHYATERRARPEQSLEVAFFHGGLPSDALLVAAGPHPKRVACLPGDLSPATLDRLQQAGITTIELDLGSPQTDLRRGIGRRLSASALEHLIHGLHDRSLRVGAVLSPGIPGSTHDTAVADAQWVVATQSVQFVRLLPALAWAGTPSADHVEQGRWTPMSIAQAVTTIASMMDCLEGSGVEVARVGLQPGPDLRARVHAGPVHPGLRALVENRRYRRKMREVLALMPRRRAATLRVHPADLAWARGEANANVRALRAALRLTELRVVADPAVVRGAVLPGEGPLA